LEVAERHARRHSTPGWLHHRPSHVGCSQGCGVSHINAPGERPAKPVRSSRKLDSAARAPISWIPAAMHDRQDDDLIVGRSEVNGVWKLTDEGSPGVALHAWIGQRVL